MNKDTILKLSKNIKIIANGAVGFGNIDVKAAREKNISVTNTPEVLTDATADVAILLLLGASRRAFEEEKQRRNKIGNGLLIFTWKANVYNKKLGILGMGRIGRAVAKELEGLIWKFIIIIEASFQTTWKGAIFHKDIKSFLENCDFLSINCPATQETTKIINEKTLKYLAPNCVIGNSARGDIVDDDAMIKALKDGKVFAYGLDVYNGEPKIHPEYLKLKNIFLLPHLGSATKRTRWDMLYRATKNLEMFFNGEKPLDLVN